MLGERLHLIHEEMLIMKSLRLLTLLIVILILAGCGSRVGSEEVVDVDLKDRPFSVRSDAGEYKCKSLIIASGASARFLGLPGEQRFMGKGVSACATCDGFFFKNQEVMVVGGGDTACEEALFLSKFAREVILVHRRFDLRAQAVLQEELRNNKKIRLILNHIPTAILGEQLVEGIKLKEKEKNKE